MELNKKQRNILSLIKDINKGKYNLKHPLQRCEGQWNALQKSELITSMLREYPIDPSTIIVSTVDEDTGEVKNENNAVIDGVQRLSTWRDFFNNEFKLSKKLKDKPFIINGTSYSTSEMLWGKKYNDLDEEIKSRLDAFDVSLDLLSGATKDDVYEIFRRKNNGKPLTNAQKNAVIISDDLYKLIMRVLSADGYSLETEKRHRSGDVVTNEKSEPVMKEIKLKNLWKRILSTGVFKNGEDRNIVLETMMLVSDYSKEHSFGFRNEDIKNFIVWFDGLEVIYDESGEIEKDPREDVINLVIAGADAVNKRLKDKIPNLKKTSIAMLVAGMCKVVKNKAGKDKYMEKVYQFFNDYENQIEYKELLRDNSASAENVNKRWQVFYNFAKES